MQDKAGQKKYIRFFFHGELLAYINLEKPYSMRRFTYSLPQNHK